ncbi:hypothetical protein [Bosea sp. 685]|uniref:hypothetical protein n=1 Tax=Bosea sp. 685 TaxID=3080057 RepID=UPI002892CCAC|nr:hypothetical protein [Bosea sp. 685]WNJ90517.1 hypothetical protein RMR04_29795 [Bosea sp. 685]
MTRALTATFALCLYAGCPATGTELVNLDDFIGGIEKADSDSACRTSAPVSALWKEIRLRYVPDPGASRLAKVNLPAQFAVAFGKAKLEKRDIAGYRRVSIPLTGIYRGLRTQQLTFDMGIENGISVVSILFAASQQEVESVLGKDLARATPTSWGEAKIVSRGGAAELVCDLSS